jgi:hypothetical protein
MAASRIRAIHVDAAERFVAVVADNAVLFLHSWNGDRCVAVPLAPNESHWRGGIIVDPTDSSRLLMLQFDTANATATLWSIDALAILHSDDHELVALTPVRRHIGLFDAAQVARAQAAFMRPLWRDFDFQPCADMRSQMRSLAHTSNGALYVVDGRAWMWRFDANNVAAPPVRVPLFVEMGLNQLENMHVSVALATRDDLLFVAHAQRVVVVRGNNVIFSLVSPDYVFADPPSIAMSRDRVAIGCQNGSAALFRVADLPLAADGLSWREHDPAYRVDLARWRVGDEWPDENCFFAATEWVLQCDDFLDSPTVHYGRDVSGIGFIDDTVWVGQGAIITWRELDSGGEMQRMVHANTDANEIVDDTTFATHGHYLMVGSDSAMRSSKLMAEAQALLPQAEQPIQRRDLQIAASGGWCDAVLLRIEMREVLHDRWWRERQRWRLFAVATGLASLNLPALLVWHIFEWDDISVDEKVSMARAWNEIALIKNAKNNKR